MSQIKLPAGFAVVKQFTNCHNAVFLAKDTKGKLVVVKTNSKDVPNDDIQNEMNFYQNRELLREKYNLMMPGLIDIVTISGRSFIITEYVEGKSYSDLISTNSFSDSDLKELAHITHNIESLEFIPTIRSVEKKALSSTDWDDVFHKNKEKWFREVDLFLGGNETLTQIYQLAGLFHFDEVGTSGIHGSAKMDEFIKTSEGTVIVDWEKASTVYINFYQTASIASYLSLRMGKLNLARDFIREREDSLDGENREKFRGHFREILAQRMLGDVWDLVFVEKRTVGEVRSDYLYSRSGGGII